MRYQWRYPTEGTRFARSAREAFGHPVSFHRPRNPDRPVMISCAIGFVVYMALIVTGAL